MLTKRQATKTALAPWACQT